MEYFRNIKKNATTIFSLFWNMEYFGVYPKINEKLYFHFFEYGVLRIILQSNSNDRCCEFLVILTNRTTYSIHLFYRSRKGLQRGKRLVAKYYVFSILCRSLNKFLLCRWQNKINQTLQLCRPTRDEKKMKSHHSTDPGNSAPISQQCSSIASARNN